MTDPTTIAHLSDLHFGRHDPRAVDALVAELDTRRPDAVVISGDLTQRAGRTEFALAKQFIDRLPVAPLVVPGNHDLPAWNVIRRFVSPLHHYRHYVSSTGHPTWDNSEVSILGVDTTRPAGPYLDWSRGRISTRLLQQICHHFEQVDARKVKVLVTHHPFTRKPGARRRRVIDTPDDCLEVLGAAGVELILSGHFHQGHIDVVQTSGDALIHAAQAGTATSVRLKGEPNSFNWLTLSSDGNPRVAVQVRVLQLDQTWRCDDVV